jgi:hypothetical protein
VDKEDDKIVDGGDVSDDETEDGLGGGADSANSGDPVAAVPPVVTALEIIDQAGGDATPTDSDDFVFVSNEASGVLEDLDVEMSEVSIAGELFCVLSPTLSHYTSLVPTKKGRKRAAPTQGPSVGEGSSGKGKKRKG